MSNNVKVLLVDDNPMILGMLKGALAPLGMVSTASDAADALLKDLPKPSKVPLDTDPPIPLWNTWPVLALFLLLLTVEWVFRKRQQMV